MHENPNPTTTEATEPASEAVSSQPDTEPESGPSTDDPTALRREAAKWRRALREEQAKTKALTEREDARDRAEVERFVSKSLLDATDLWGSVQLDELRDDDGTLDRELVSEAVKTLVQRKPHFARPAEPMPNLMGGARTPVPEGPSFGREMRKALRKWPS